MAADNETQSPDEIVLSGDNVETSADETFIMVSDGKNVSMEMGVLDMYQGIGGNTTDGVHGEEPTPDQNANHSVAVEIPIDVPAHAHHSEVTTSAQTDNLPHAEHTKEDEQSRDEQPGDGQSGEEATTTDSLTEQTVPHDNEDIQEMDAPSHSQQQPDMARAALGDTGTDTPRSDAPPLKDDEGDDSNDQLQSKREPSEITHWELKWEFSKITHLESKREPSEMMHLEESLDTIATKLPISNHAPSPAQTEWDRQKQDCNAKCHVVDIVMKLVGREDVKQFFLTMHTRLREALDSSRRIFFPDLNLWIVGNPGSGKRAIANLYAAFLQEIIPSSINECTRLYGQDFSRAQFHNYSNEVLIFENVQVMDIDHYRVRRRFYNNIYRMNCKNTVFVATGRPGGPISDLESSPYYKTTFRHRLTLKDYDLSEVKTLACSCIMSHGFQLEGGWDSEHLLVAMKRLVRVEQSEIFGNMHTIETVVSAMIERHMQRVMLGATSEKKTATNGAPEDTVEDEKEMRGLGFLSAVDILGPKPSDSIHSDAWKELESMVGLEQVKDSIRELQGLAGVNYDRAVQGLEPIKLSLNSVFLGPPGTGKTTSARLYGQVLADMGLLSSREVVYKTPSDFISQYIGDSEANTHSILTSARGKVLIIDEAHTFFYGSTSTTGSSSNFTDSYRLGIIDTLVSLVDGKPGTDQCVLLLGYTEHMREMFQKANPGLQRRFPLEKAFVFENYGIEVLMKILDQKMEEQNVSATDKAREVAKEVLTRGRDRPNFGNGGDVDNLLSKAKASYRARRKKEAKEAKEKEVEEDGTKCAEAGEKEAKESNASVFFIYDNMELQPQDFDENYDRDLTAPARCDELFKPLVGFDSIRNQFRGIQQTAVHMRRHGKDPRACIPFTYIFKGPPGTGKTHTARILGQIFYDMGFLSKPEVIDVSATNLIGMYEGHTGQKVIELFDRALGKVLFIDEAYRLATRPGGTSSFQDEAVGEIVDCLTKPRYARKLIVVLAGYERDMDRLLRVNTGLRSRFAAEVSFPVLDGLQCYAHLQTCLRQHDVDIKDHDWATDDERETVMRLFRKLGMTYGWANARDVETLARSIVTHIYEDPEKALQMEEHKEVGGHSGDWHPDRAIFAVTTEDVIKFMKIMLKQRIRGGGGS